MKCKVLSMQTFSCLIAHHCAAGWCLGQSSSSARQVLLSSPTMAAAANLDVEAVLAGCLSIDNEVRKQAEEAVKQLSHRPEVIPQLVQQVQAAADSQVRQLAAVLLRKWMKRHWDKLPGEVRTQLQQVLLDRTAHESAHAVRRALANCIAAAAEQSVPSGQWPSLLGFLHQCSQADSAEHKEVALLLFAALFETVGEHLAPHVPSILSAVASGASHPTAHVQTAALSVIEPLLPFVTDGLVPAFHQLLAALLPCAQAAVAAGNEDLLVQLCQVLEEVAECPAPLLQPCLQQVLEMCMVVATNKNFSSQTREQGLALLHWMAKYKPKQLQRNKVLLKAIIEALCEMTCEPCPADCDEDQETPPNKVAAVTLDTLSIHLSSSAVFPTVWQFIQSAGSSQETRRRAAAFTVCAVLAEGCAEQLRKRLNQVLPALLSALSDPGSDVRGAAAFALGQFSEYLQPDITQHHQAVLPAVFRLLQDPDNNVQERACYAVDAFCEHLEASEIMPYVPQLVEQLMAVLQSGRPGVQEMALSAVSSIAAAAQGAFQPYTAQMLPVLNHFMQQTGGEYVLCRCRAIESAGILVEALGAQDPNIGPNIPGMVEVVLSAFTSTDSPDLRDYSHSMFGNVAKALGEGFAPWLPRVVPLAVASCEQEDGAFGSEGESEGEEAAEEGGEDSSSEDEDGRGHFNVRTGVMDEKVSATTVLGSYAEACPSAFMPFMAQALDTLSTMVEYWHDEARAAAYDSLHKLVLAAHSSFPPCQHAPSNGTPSVLEPVELSPQAKHVLGTVLPLLTSPAEYDTSKVAVAAAAGALGQLLKQLGRGAVGAEHLEATTKMAQVLLHGRAICQEVEDDDEEGGELDEEDLSTMDEDLLAAAADLLPALAASMGPDAYAPHFLAAHAEPLLNRLKPQQPLPLRAIAAGAAAEVAEVLGTYMGGVVALALPLLLRELQADDDINRQNAAYCTGLLVQSSPAQAGPFLPQVLAALHTLFRADEAAGARDNAVGAVGRIMLAVPQALPLGQVLPVYLGALPLREDLSETTPAVEPLCRVLLADPQPQEVQQHIPQIVQIFGQIASQASAPSEARVMVARTLCDLQACHPSSMGPLLAQLPPEQQAALQQLVGAECSQRC